METIKEKTERTKRKLDPKIIRVGDTVKIVNPQLFVRCGYPLSIEDMEEEVKELFMGDIDDLVNSMGFDVFTEAPRRIDFDYSRLNKGKVYRKIIRELAYIRLRRKNFGGNERKVFTEPYDEYKDLEAEVTGIKICKSGTYNQGYGGGCDYWTGQSDYEPAYLSPCKTHKILTLDRYQNDIISSYTNHIRIEAKYVEKIMEEQ